MQDAPVTGIIALVAVGRRAWVSVAITAGTSVLVAVRKEVIVDSILGLDAACVSRFIAWAVSIAAVKIKFVSRVGSGAGAKMLVSVLIETARPKE
jgi:hypothetical protein